MREFRIGPDGLQLRLDLSGKTVDEIAEATEIRADIIGYILSGEVEASKAQTTALVEALGVSINAILWERLNRVLDTIEKYDCTDPRVRRAVVDGLYSMEEIEIIVTPRQGMGWDFYGLWDALEEVLSTPVKLVTGDMVNDDEETLTLVRREDVEEE